jgi:hypothetical protein
MHKWYGDCCLKANCSLIRLQFAFKQQSPDKSTVEKQHKYINDMSRLRKKNTEVLYLVLGRPWSLFESGLKGGGLFRGCFGGKYRVSEGLDAQGRDTTQHFDTSILSTFLWHHLWTDTGFFINNLFARNCKLLSDL